MDSGLLWTVVGGVTGVAAVGLTAWQVRLQLVERRQARSLRLTAVETTVPGPGGLSVAVPLGRLPVEVRGRDMLLAELSRTLNKPSSARRRGAARVWVLAGMGGLGKSTVALVTAQTARARGWQVWWVNASNPASFTGGMLEILTQLGAPESVIRPVREGSPTAADRAWEFLNGHHRARWKWLLVLDNADHPAVLAGHGRGSPADHAGWLRADPAGVVVVTTRTKDPRAWGRGVALRVLTRLDDDAASRVLLDLAPGIADPRGSQARGLAQRLGGLPLALHLAGSYLALPFARWHSFADYCQALDSGELPAALAALDDPAAQARATILRTWNASLDALAAEGQAQARPLILLLSCYAPATAIPAGLLHSPQLAGLFTSQSAGPETVAGQPVSLERQLHDGLQGLLAVGLIDLAPADDSPNDPGITVHPVVADANRSSLLTTEGADLARVSEAAVRLLYAWAGQLETARAADWPRWLEIIPHLTALLDWLAPHLDHPILADLLCTGDAAAEALRWSGNAPAAEKLAQSSLTAATRLGESHPAVLTSQHKLAQTMADQGRDKVAEAMYRQVLCDQQRVLGDDHPSTLTTRDNLAWIIECQGRYHEAEDLYRQLISDQQRVLGATHDETLAATSGLARVIGLLGRYREAEQLCVQVLADQQHELGDERPETLATQHNLAWIISLQGRYEEAERICRQALAGRQRVLGDRHPSTLTTRLRYARMLAGLGRYTEAESLCREVLHDRRQILGDEHPATLTARHELGRVIGPQGRYAETEQIYRTVLADRLQIMNADHPHALITRQHLGWVIGCQGRFQEAEVILTEVLHDRRRVLGNDHPDTLSTYFRLAEVVARQGRHQEAADFYGMAITGRQQALGDQHPDTVTARAALAELISHQDPNNSRLTLPGTAPDQE